MKIACVIILYHPGKTVITNLESYLFCFEKNFVIDNTEVEINEVAKKISGFGNTHYLHDGHNKGIAARLNQACDYALAEGFDWLLTMDQDSFFEKNMLNKYLNYVEQYKDKKNVAMFGVNYEDNTTFNNRGQEVETLITSGSILNLNLFKNIGSFDENLFIDYVDVDYCMRALSNDYKIIKFNDAHLNHFIGKGSVHMSLKSFKLSERALHSPVRLYYMVRNFMYISQKYRYRYDRIIKEYKKQLLISIKNNVLYGRKRLSVVSYIIKGVRDYNARQMGKLVE